ncbi:MAG: fatty acid desaturase [Rhizobiaceae bacterium]|nr:fatty acid desaturase [Rhizobiaceae bacterium]
MADRKRSRRHVPPAVEWPTLAMIAACYAAWLILGFVAWPLYPLPVMLCLAVVLALQSSLMHEASHGHPTRSAAINELLVGLPIGLIYPFRRFKATHLKHHADERLTDPFDDPESYYRALWKHERLPAWLRIVLKINSTMLGRFVIGPLVGTPGFLLEEWRLVRAGDRAVRRAWLHHAAGLAIVLPLVQFGFGMPLWLYLLVPVWLGQSLIAIRTFAEHQWSERPDGRTIIVERSPLSVLFLNNNLHFVHHKMPNVAWYRLPGLFRERRDEWLRRNGNYSYPSYFALFRDFALSPKEPVVHPVLRRLPEAGRAFSPRVRARNVNGLGTAPVPAEPPKE